VPENEPKFDGSKLWSVHLVLKVSFRGIAFNALDRNVSGR